MNQKIQIFMTALKLGISSFGGPIAHLAYFRKMYVDKLRWLDEHEYANRVALCQFIPGPASSQVGISIGYTQGGIFGAFASWFGFTMPSVLFLIVCAHFLQANTLQQSPILHGFKLVAVCVVAHALYGMGKNLLTDTKRQVIFILASTILLLVSSVPFQLLTIFLCGVVAIFLYPKRETESSPISLQSQPSTRRSIGIISFILWIALLLGLPLLYTFFPNDWVYLASEFFRSGSIVFGGGHVVLPLLETSFVDSNMISSSTFLAGYGITQIVPGPLFTFAAYIGTSIAGVLGGLWSTFWMFLPSFLLVFAALPVWNRLSQIDVFKRALFGINAAVVAILFAAFVDPIFTKTVTGNIDFVILLFGFMLLEIWKTAPWKVVVCITLLGTCAAYFLQ
ncbi:MAG: chromate efflux transporter [Bacilli bacterium]